MLWSLEKFLYLKIWSHQRQLANSSRIICSSSWFVSCYWFPCTLARDNIAELAVWIPCPLPQWLSAYIFLWRAAVWYLVASHPQTHQKCARSSTLMWLLLPFWRKCSHTELQIRVCMQTNLWTWMYDWSKYSWWFIADIWSPDRTSTSINDQLMDQWFQALTRKA